MATKIKFQEGDKVTTPMEEGTGTITMIGFAEGKTVYSVAYGAAPGGKGNTTYNNVGESSITPVAAAKPVQGKPEAPK